MTEDNKKHLKEYYNNMALEIRMLYSSLVDAGFTSDEAFTLVQHGIATNEKKRKLSEEELKELSEKSAQLRLQMEVQKAIGDAIANN